MLDWVQKTCLGTRDCGGRMQKEASETASSHFTVHIFLSFGVPWKDRIVEIPVQKKVAVPQALLCNQLLEFNIAVKSALWIVVDVQGYL